MPLAFPAQLQATLNVLAIDPQVSGVYLAGLSSDLPAYSGMLRSTDNGARWLQVPDLRNRQVRAIAFNKFNSKVIAAGTDTGVFLSQDRGITWKRISPLGNRQLQPIMSLAFSPKNNATLFAGTPRLPWMTVDSGASWISIATGMLEDSDIFSIQVDRNRPQRILASACSGIYRSLDGGAIWTPMNGATDASYRTYVIVQDPQYENVWFAGTANGIVRSRDGGNTWVKIGAYSTRSIAFDPGRLGRMLIATDQAGILRSDDNGLTWRSANRGFCNRLLSSLWVARDGLHTSSSGASANSGTFRLKVDAGGWVTAGARERAAGTGVEEFITVAGGRRLKATSSGLKASDDSGASWQAVGGELGSDSIQTVYRHPDRSDTVFAAVFGAIYSSADAGRSWRRISPEDWPTSSVRQFAILPNLPGRLFILTQQQGVWAMELDPR
jgi:photosystem II stability/assembly factor-like uncharacterized protein